MHKLYIFLSLLCFTNFALIAGESNKKEKIERQYDVAAILKNLPRPVGMQIASMAEDRFTTLTITTSRFEYIYDDFGSPKKMTFVQAIRSRIVPSDHASLTANDSEEISRKTIPYDAQAKRILFKYFYDKLAQEEEQKNKHKQ